MYFSLLFSDLLLPGKLTAAFFVGVLLPEDGVLLIIIECGAISNVFSLNKFD